MSCGVGHRCGSDPTLQWLWYRLAAAAPIGPLAWEFPYASSLKIKKKGTVSIDKGHQGTTRICTAAEALVSLPGSNRGPSQASLRDSAPVCTQSSSEASLPRAA